jgi:phage/plasmid-associated DNA primase
LVFNIAGVASTQAIRGKRIPWNHSFEKDPDFSEKHEAELPEILNWMLGGLRQWFANGKRLPDCKAVDEATAE